MVAGKIVAAEKVVELIHRSHFRLQLRIRGKYPALETCRSTQNAFIQQRPQHKHFRRPFSFVGRLYPWPKLLSIADKKDTLDSPLMQIAGDLCALRRGKHKFLW